MARSIKKSTYARIVGEISIEWNYLERAMQLIAFGYLRGDSDIAAHIFGGMGNVSLAEFALYLCRRREQNETVKGHVEHFVKLFNAIRENRNILEHGIPQISRYLEEFQDVVHKPNKTGVLQPFSVPVARLREALEKIVDAQHYSRPIRLAIWRDQFDLQTAAAALVEYLASLDKPALPRKLDPLPPEVVPRGGQPRPQSSQAKAPKGKKRP